MKRYDDIELLKELCLLFGPSGAEDDVREFIKSQLSDICDEFYVDRLGNLVAKINGKGNGVLMISAHMDEVGFMVKGIKKAVASATAFLFYVVKIILSKRRFRRG